MCINLEIKLPDWCRWHNYHSDTLPLSSMDVLITWFELMQSRIGTTHLARSVCAAPTHPHVVILFTCLFPGPQMAVVNGTLMAEVARTSLLIWVHILPVSPSGHCEPIIFSIVTFYWACIIVRNILQLQFLFYILLLKVFFILLHIWCLYLVSECNVPKLK